MKKILYILGAIGLMFSSCTKNDEFDNSNSEGNGAVQFTAGVPTRVSENSEWEANDLIGIFAGSSVKNSCYKIETGNNGAMVYEDGDVIYSPKEGEIQTYCAYYPYNKDANNGTLIIDLTEEVNQKPLVWAKTEHKGSNINLSFSHQLVKLNLTFTAGGRDIKDLDGATATLKGAKTQGEFKVLTGEWDNSKTEANDLPLTISDQGTSKTLTTYVMATPDVKTQVTIEIEVGRKTFVWRPTTDEWVAGNEYNYDITIGRASAKRGDYYYNDGVYSTTKIEGRDSDIIGIVFSVNSNGTSGKVVSLESTLSVWLNEEGDATGANSDSNGLVNMSKVWNGNSGSPSANRFEKYPAFKWVHEINTKANAHFDAATGYAEKAKNVWYFPSKKELRELYAGYCGLQWVESGAQAGQVNDWGDRKVMPKEEGYDYDTNKDNFNRILVDEAGGSSLVSYYEYYWSSTEDDGNTVATYAWIVSFKDGKTTVASKSSAESYYELRAILAF